MYNSTLYFTSALDGGVWSTPCPSHFTPRKDPVPIVQEAGWDRGSVWTVAENLATTRIRSPDRPARSESLYRLRYPGPHENDSVNPKFLSSVQILLPCCLCDLPESFCSVPHSWLEIRLLLRNLKLLLMCINSLMEFVDCYTFFVIAGYFLVS